MKIFEKWFVIIILLILLVLIGENVRLSMTKSATIQSAGNPFANLAAKPKTGFLVPDFELPAMDGSKKAVNQFRGKAVMINFWTSWCVGCLVEMPLIKSAADQHNGELVVLAVNVGETLDEIKPHALQTDESFQVLLDSEGKVADTFGVFGYPATFFVDKEGIIQHQQIGQMTEKILKENLKTIGIDAW